MGLVSCKLPATSMICKFTGLDGKGGMALPVPLLAAVVAVPPAAAVAPAAAVVLAAAGAVVTGAVVAVLSPQAATRAARVKQTKARPSSLACLESFLISFSSTR